MAWASTFRCIIRNLTEYLHSNSLSDTWGFILTNVFHCGSLGEGLGLLLFPCAKLPFSGQNHSKVLLAKSKGVKQRKFFHVSELNYCPIFLNMSILSRSGHRSTERAGGRGRRPSTIFSTNPSAGPRAAAPPPKVRYCLHTQSPQSHCTRKYT